MSAPQKFRKKPVEIEAMQYDGANANDIRSWMGTGYETSPLLVIRTLEGAMRADPDDWIIRGVQGEFYPCKPDIFEQTYERPVLASAAPPPALVADEERSGQARAELGRAVVRYYAEVEPDVYVDGWVLVSHKRTPDLEQDGKTVVGVVTPEQSWPLTRGLLDIALTSDRDLQNR